MFDFIYKSMLFGIALLGCFMLIAVMIAIPNTLFFFVPLFLFLGYKLLKFNHEQKRKFVEHQRNLDAELRKQEEQMKTKYVIIQGEDNWRNHYQPKK